MILFSFDAIGRIMANLPFEEISDDEAANSGDNDFGNHVKAVVNHRVHEHQKVTLEFFKDGLSPATLTEKPLGVSSKKDIS